MKAITLHQPWASFIAHGYKTIDRKMSVVEKAAKGKSYFTEAGSHIIARCRTHKVLMPMINKNWTIPSGAFRECGGPS